MVGYRCQRVTLLHGVGCALQSGKSFGRVDSFGVTAWIGSIMPVKHRRLHAAIISMAALDRLDVRILLTSSLWATCLTKQIFERRHYPATANQTRKRQNLDASLVGEEQTEGTTGHRPCSFVLAPKGYRQPFRCSKRCWRKVTSRQRQPI